MLVVSTDLDLLHEVKIFLIISFKIFYMNKIVYVIGYSKIDFNECYNYIRYID